MWRTALTVDPDFVPAHTGLGDLYLRSKNETGLSHAITSLRELATDSEVEAAVSEARRLGGNGDHASAAQVLLKAIDHDPQALGFRVTLSHVRLADGSPPEVLEAAFDSVPEVDPANAQARHNMQVLLRNTGRWVEGVI